MIFSKFIISVNLKLYRISRYLYKMEIRRDLGIGSELKIFVDACLERLNVICCWGNDGRKRVQSLDAIGINELANAFLWLVLIQFKRVEVLILRKSCNSRK